MLILKSFFIGIVTLLILSDKITETISLNNIEKIQVIHEIYDAPNDQLAQETTYLAFDMQSKLLGIVNAAAPWVDGDIYFFDMSSFENVDIIQDISLTGTSLHFTHAWLLIGKENGQLERYNLSSGELHSTVDVGGGGDIEVISASTDQTHVAATSTTEIRGDYVFYLAKFDEKPIVHISIEELGRGYSVAFHPSENIVAFAVSEPYRENLVTPLLRDQDIITTVQIWDADAGNLISLCDEYRTAIAYTDTLAFTPHGQNIIYAADDGIRVWDLRDCRQFDDAWSILEPINETQYLTTFVMHPTEPLLVSAYRSVERGRGIIRFWNIETGEMLHEITDYGAGEYNAITTLAFSPDGTLLASGGQDGTVRLWGIPAGDGD